MKTSLLNLIVNIWDPYDVYGLGPLDEYNDICEKIITLKHEGDMNKLYGYLISQYLTKNLINKEKINALIEIIKGIDV